MNWRTIYLILGILSGLLGIWNLARRRSFFLALLGIFWFLIVLFRFSFPSLFDTLIMKGLPQWEVKAGDLVQYLLLPVFLILAFFTGGRRR